MKKISVIIPVYNVEKYLKDCIDSILMQSMQDYEIILVDDGSTDRSGAICDEYANKKENIFAYHKENGGPSDARNLGISKAKGEYIVFVDSDDYFDDYKIFEKMLTASQNGQIDVVAYCIKFYDAISGRLQEKQYYDESINDLPNLEEKLKYVISNDQTVISSCGYAVKREFILKNDLFFEKGIVAEDTERTMRIFSCNPSIVFVNEPAYCTRRGRPGSLSTVVENKNVKDLFYVIKMHSDKFKESENVLLNYMAYQYCVLCGILAKISDKEFKEEISKEIIEYKWLLKYDLSPKVKKVKKVYKFFGIKNTVKILGFYLNHRRKR
ncbi:MAG: glycosyltransferase family 2 protein [Clostridia bacterium]|nr:glycosyltransferase family 2 protein [Clostridia bacterium]